MQINGFVESQINIVTSFTLMQLQIVEQQCQFFLLQPPKDVECLYVSCNSTSGNIMKIFIHHF